MADVLVFGAHPDDAEFGMGGTILTLRRAGKSVAICVLTRGEAGSFGTPQVREQEMRAAAAHAGAELEILDFRDCQVTDSYENRLKLAAVIRKHRPALIFAPYHTQQGGHLDGVAHPDHAALGVLAKHAARYAKFKGLQDLQGAPWAAPRMLYYMVPRHLAPAIVNDVTPVMDEWEALAQCHASQLQILDGKVLEFLKCYRSMYGALMRVQYGEGFLCDEPLPFEGIL